MTTLAIVLSVELTACQEEETAKRAEPKVRVAKLIKVGSTAHRQMLTFPAIVNASQFAELSFKVSGEVIEFNVLEGQTVAAGDIIAKVDPTTFENRQATAQAEYDNAADELARAESLIARSAISHSEYETRRTRRDVARADLRTAQKDFRDTVVRAPFDGTVARVHARAFQNAQANDQVLLLHSDALEAVINVPGNVIAHIPDYSAMKLTIRLDDAPGSSITGRFHEVASSADEDTQTYEVAVRFDPPDSLRVLPGMTAAVDLEIQIDDENDEDVPRILVPLSALFSDGGETYVWSVDPNTFALSKKAVAVGPMLDENATILSGLKTGETIIGAGVSFFHEGMTVSPWDRN